MAMPTSPLMLLVARRCHLDMSFGPNPALSYAVCPINPTAGGQKWWWGALKDNAKAGVTLLCHRAKAEMLIVRCKGKPSWVWA